MAKTLNTIENVSIALGVSVGINQIESVLGIILLVFQIILLTCKLFTKLKVKIKEIDTALTAGDLNVVDDILEDVEEHIENYVEDVKEIINNGDKQ